MIKNLFVVAFRNLKKYPGYSLLNIFGLMIGITFSLFLIFYIRDELSYDQYHTKADRIYRLNSFIQESDREEMSSAITPFPTAPALQTKFPEVEQAVRLVPSPRILFKNGDVRLFEEKIYYTDSNYFKVFSGKIIEGNPNTALIAPKSIVLTESVAKKYFGKTTGLLAKTLVNDNNESFTVNAVMEDV
ncbi:MAG: ABC transporter permease, partial [Chitinophagaceae bacterium]